MKERMLSLFSLCVSVAISTSFLSPAKSNQSIGQVLSASDPQDAFRFLVAGFESNCQRLKSGKGLAIWTMHGLDGEGYGGTAKPGTTLKIEVDFAFDGDKLRWDRHFDPAARRNGYPGAKRQAYDGRVEYDYIVPQQATAEADAYIRPGSPSSGGEYIGRRIDLKHMMQPTHIPMKLLKTVLADDPNVPLLFKVEEVSSTSQGLVQAKVHMAPLVKADWATRDIYLTFDPEKNYNIVSEKGFEDGRLLSSVHRTFEQHGDVWSLKSMEHTEYVPYGPEKAAGRLNIQITHFEANPVLPDDTFDFGGFDLPANVRIWDHTIDMNYKLNPKEVLDAQVRKLLKEREHFTAAHTQLVKPQEPNLNAAWSARDTNDPATSTGSLEDRPLSGPGAAAYMAVAIVIVSVSAAVAAITFLRRRS